jgi:Mg2+/citrate symporter
MYLIVIAWFYVTAMMALAEATSPQGSLLGALITFVLYGLLPMGILVYIFGTPERKRKLKVRRQAQQRAYDEALQAQTTEAAADSALPDAGGHAPGATQHSSITAVRKEP